MYNIDVTTDAVLIDKLISITKGSYGEELTFNFIGDKWDGLIKKAVFDGKETLIIDNICTIPAEVTEATGNKKLGVYGYALENNELKLRISPYPSIFCVIDGSFDKSLSEAGTATPTDFERQLAELEETKEMAIDTLGSAKDKYTEELAEVIDGATKTINDTLNSAKSTFDDEASEAIAELQQRIDNGDYKGDKGDKGDTYTLTEADKAEIADIVQTQCLNELESIIDDSGVLE